MSTPSITTDGNGVKRLSPTPTATGASPIDANFGVLSSLATSHATALTNASAAIAQAQAAIDAAQAVIAELQGSINGLGTAAYTDETDYASAPEFATLVSRVNDKLDASEFNSLANQLGTAAYTATTDYDAAGAATAAAAGKLDKSANLSDVASAATARTNLGLGSAATTNATAFDTAGAAAAVASSLTAHTNRTDNPHATTAAQVGAYTTAQVDTIANAKLAKASNLSDLASASSARTNLGLGSAAITNTGTSNGNVPLLGSGGSLSLVGLLSTTNIVQAAGYTLPYNNYGNYGVGGDNGFTGLSLNPTGGSEFAGIVTGDQTNIAVYPYEIDFNTETYFYGDYNYFGGPLSAGAGLYVSGGLLTDSLSATNLSASYLAATVSAHIGPYHSNANGRFGISGTLGELSFLDRGQTAWVETPTSGQRWVWYASGGMMRLWSGRDMLTVDGNGSMTLAQSNSSVPLTVTQTGSWTGSNYALQVNGYANINGFRINASDADNSLLQQNNQDIGFATSSTSKAIRFHIGPYNEKMRIHSNGCVGIGTTAPAYKLHVVGNTLLNGNVTTGNVTADYLYVSDGFEVGGYATFDDSVSVAGSVGVNGDLDVGHWLYDGNINTLCVVNCTNQNIDTEGFSTVPVTKVLDLSNSFNNSTHIYTCPITGYYRVTTKLRLPDGTSEGYSYGQGAGVTNSDGPHFSWFAAAPNRNGSLNTRVLKCAAGDQLRMYAYIDFDAGSNNVNAAEMTIELLGISTRDTTGGSGGEGGEGPQQGGEGGGDVTGEGEGQS